MTSKGYRHTPEALAKISAESKNRKRGSLSPETRAKLSIAHTGLRLGPPSAATRAKISAGRTGKSTGFGNTNMRDASVKGECVYCFGPAQTYDHMIPRGRPRWDNPDNVVPACFVCNSSKNQRTPDEWLAAGLIRKR